MLTNFRSDCWFRRRLLMMSGLLVLQAATFIWWSLEQIRFHGELASTLASGPDGAHPLHLLGDSSPRWVVLAALYGALGFFALGMAIKVPAMSRRFWIAVAASEALAGAWLASPVAPGQADISRPGMVVASLAAVALLTSLSSRAQPLR